jgi:hypothetical protein
MNSIARLHARKGDWGAAVQEIGDAPRTAEVQALLHKYAGD